jgi:serine/threonine-protein kinase
LTNGLVTSFPVWSPDGRFVVFASAGGLFAVQTDGAGLPAQLTRSNARQVPQTFSPDGRLVFTVTGPGAKAEIRISSVERESGQLRVREPQPLLKTPHVVALPSFSPDGRWLAYSNAESGAYEVYVRAFPDNGRQVQVSNAGGIMPLWSRNGRELFYRTVDQRIMVASYSVQSNAFIPQRPRPWYGKPIANVGDNWNLDLAHDGKRFVVLMPAEVMEARESRSHVRLVMNFFDEVRRRAEGPGR